jgi:GH24 family phage-related lysozyme (muramidase)
MRHLKLTVLVSLFWIIAFCYLGVIHKPAVKTVKTSIGTVAEQVDCLASAIYYDSQFDLEAQKTSAIDIANLSTDYMNVCKQVNKQNHEWIEIAPKQKKTAQVYIVARNIYWLRFHNTEEPGIAQIEKSEGFADHAYYDVTGYSIGYGTFLRNKELLATYRHKIITQQEAERLMIDEVIYVEVTINELVRVPLTENQLAALTSFCYNEGTTQFARSDMLTYLNQGKYTAASNEFKKWVYIQGKKSDSLAARRLEEKNLFLKE